MELARPKELRWLTPRSEAGGHRSCYCRDRNRPVARGSSPWAELVDLTHEPGGVQVRDIPRVRGTAMRHTDRLLLAPAVLFAWMVAANPACAADTPASRPVPVPLNGVKIEDAFWSPKL